MPRIIRHVPAAIPPETEPPELMTRAAVESESDLTVSTIPQQGRRRQAGGEVEELAIYDGLAFIGLVRPRDRARAFDAFSGDGEALGVFTRPDAAARSIYLAHVERQRQAVA